MIDFKKHINKQAKSYEIACKCARTSDIYAKSVLEANKFNLNFLYHLRSLEADICKEFILQAIFRTETVGACTINIITTNIREIFKVMSNADLDEALEALDCEYYTKTTFTDADGKKRYIYRVKFNLTL